MTTRFVAITALVLGIHASALQAQPVSANPEATLGQVLSLSASAQKEIQQDWLTVVLRAHVEGSDAATVQNQLKAQVEQALAALQGQAQQAPAQAFEVRSGNFGIYPRYSDKGRVVAWQGQADLLVQGRDFVRVSQAAGQLPRLTVAQASFSLSKAARQALETEVQSQAVQKFRERAQQLAQGFGFTGYSLRQVSVSSVDRPEPPLLQARAMVADMASSAPAAAIPLAAGKDEVRITVSGSIQLR